MAKNKHSKNRTPAENNSSDLRTRKKEAVLGGEKKRKGGPLGPPSPSYPSAPLAVRLLPPRPK